jgi:hypothetical protein
MVVPLGHVRVQGEPRPPSIQNRYRSSHYPEECRRNTIKPAGKTVKGTAGLR